VASRRKPTRRQQYVADRAAWRRAIEEGRVLSFPDSLRFVSYPSVELRREAEKAAAARGVRVVLVLLKPLVEP
jgi:hypothetical protein